MHFQLSHCLTLLILTPVITAHGKVSAVVGDAGGNGTALGIIGGIVPGAGSNDVTEIDTTVFKRKRIATDGLGKTIQGGNNKAADLHHAMAQAGDKLPQVSEGGFITGTFHIITTDGAGPVSAIIDPGATGAFSKGIKAEVAENVPGNKGNIRPDGKVARALHAFGLLKRAANVNKIFPFNITVPAGINCEGTVAGVQNVCFMKIANANKAGPFGGVIAFQMAASSTNVKAAIVSREAKARARVDMDSAIGATMAKRFVA